MASHEGVVRLVDCLGFVVVRTRKPGQSCQRDRALGSVFSPGRANSLSIQYLISHGKIIIVFAKKKNTKNWLWDLTEKLTQAGMGTGSEREQPGEGTDERGQMEVRKGQIPHRRQAKPYTHLALPPWGSPPSPRPLSLWQGKGEAGTQGTAT